MTVTSGGRHGEAGAWLDAQPNSAEHLTGWGQTTCVRAAAGRDTYERQRNGREGQHATGRHDPNLRRLVERLN